MIVDSLRNAALYRGLSPRIARAFDYLIGIDPRDASARTVEIDGTRVYAIFEQYETRHPAEGAWEAHRRHIDLQCVLAGTERIGYSPIGHLVAGTYDPERDLLPLRGDGAYLTLGPGDFMLLYPDDAHMPKIAVGPPAPVSKVVVKIAVGP